MPFTKDSISAALTPLLPPGSMKSCATCEGFVSAKIHLPDAQSGTAFDSTARACLAALKQSHPGDTIAAFTAEFTDAAGKVIHTAKITPSPQHSTLSTQNSASAPAADGHRPISGLKQPSPQASSNGLPGVNRIIAVGAGKGGVGKSTVAVNLAVGLARRGHSVGILDADIYGPSLPTLLGLTGMDQAILGGQLQPFFVHGVKAITIGKMVDSEKPLIWRGPMAHGAFNQLTDQTDWGELDFLIIDLPPGTGDISLSMAQKLKLSGAVVVCTPQKVAQDDAVRALRMFQQLGIAVLGVVENMSFFVGDDGKEYDLFGRGGAEKMAQKFNVPFLGTIPITMKLRENSDDGNPIANFAGKTPLANSLEHMVNNVESQVAAAEIRTGQSKPTLTIK